MNRALSYLILLKFGLLQTTAPNIAVCILQVAEDSFDTHSYLNAVKREDNATFQRENGMKQESSIRCRNRG